MSILDKYGTWITASKKGLLSRKKLVFLVLAMIALSVTAKIASMLHTRYEMAKFFGVSFSEIKVECPQRSFSFSGKEGNRTLTMCLNRADKRKRCEVAIHTLRPAPENNHTEFKAKFADNYINLGNWFSIMQFHELPDRGETWRCPPLSLEVTANGMRMLNRWDKAKLSSKEYACTGAGSTIQSRKIFENYPLQEDNWHQLKLQTQLSAITPGSLNLSVDNKIPQSIIGENMYNDEKMPYLKLGIYRPEKWNDSIDSICVSFADVNIYSSKAVAHNIASR